MKVYQDFIHKIRHFFNIDFRLWAFFEGLVKIIVPFDFEWKVGLN